MESDNPKCCAVRPVLQPANAIKADAYSLVYTSDSHKVAMPVPAFFKPGTGGTDGRSEERSVHKDRAVALIQCMPCAKAGHEGTE
ncbi:hypothetical protein DT73_22475 [Mangrovibacter sp. MFB070]|nr:hypothetical protein DT73_22475 [Mangrovibacter sp. MFB070]